MQFIQLSNEVEGISFDELPYDTAARVKYSMAVVSRCLAKRNIPPSKNNQIRLTGIDVEKCEWIWTALMVFGKNNPNIKFGSNAINYLVQTPEGNLFFSPRQEQLTRSFLWWGGAFKKTSLYEMEFKHYVTREMLRISRTASLYADPSEQPKSKLQRWKKVPSDSFETSRNAIRIEPDEYDELGESVVNRSDHMASLLRRG